MKVCLLGLYGYISNALSAHYPDGTFFGEGVKTRIKEPLLTECNLHTIVRPAPNCHGRSPRIWTRTSTRLQAAATSVAFTTRSSYWSIC